MGSNIFSNKLFFWNNGYMKPNYFTPLLLIVVLASCTPRHEIIPEVTTKSLPTPTILFPCPTITEAFPTPTKSLIGPFPTSSYNQDNQLPFDDSSYNSEQCQSPTVLLSIADAQGFNDDTIAKKLMERYLNFFKSPKKPGYCRIDGYHVDKVYFDTNLRAKSVEPQSDIMRNVEFSIKLVQVPNTWMSWPAGDIDPQNWLHIYRMIAVFHSNNGYSMDFANP
jgi:hypothetical protein